MTYEEAVSLFDAGGVNIVKLGLERIEKLLEKMGNPQNSLKIIHVAGTNGKGSFCAIMSSVLVSAGYKVGVYTSPHLVCYEERFTLNGKKISREDFTSLAEYIADLSADIGATPFEMLTAMAFEYFKRNNADYVLLETGLGGQYDATNVIKNPILSVITQIGMDHMEYLGDTVEKIAFEKGGIIKEKVPVVLYKQDKAVFEVISEICLRKSSKLYCPESQEITVLSQGFGETVFDVSTDFFRYKSLSLGLMGNFQLKNAANALCACHALEDLGVRLTEENIREGLRNARWEGRMEIISASPKILLEGAHNIDGIRELKKSLETYCGNMPITLLLGVLGDKEYEKMIGEIVPLCEKIVLTKPENSRALDLAILADRVERIKNAEFMSESVKEAFIYAYMNTPKDGILCCAGSLYLVGAVKKLINEGILENLNDEV